LTLLEKIEHLIKDIAPKAWDHRLHIHANPELSYQEFETQKYVIEQLQLIGIKQISTLANTGVVAIIEGTKKGKCLILRADLDALPIDEENDVPYKSKVRNVMHACGHDFHTANLLGVAQILNEIKDEITGTIKLVFQPGEEKNPGGAKLMIEAGVLEKPSVDAAIALHVFPAFTAGNVGFYPGLYMASCDEIYITIKGKGGHAATPHLVNNPIYPMAEMLIMLNEINAIAKEKDRCARSN
jgi:amidohydrolase